MNTIQLIEFFAGAFLSELVGTIGGFGSATLFTAFAALFLNLKAAIALVAVFHFSGAMVRLAYFRRHIEWNVFGWFMASDIVFTLVGAGLIAVVSDAAIKILFGSFLILYSLTALLAPRFTALPRKKIFLLAGGVVSGFLAGLIGTGGAARTVAMQAFQLPKSAYLGTSAAMAVVTDFVRFPVYVASGIIEPSAFVFGLAGGLVLIAAVGAFLGSRIAEKISESAFRIAIHVLLLFAGAYFIFS